MTKKIIWMLACMSCFIHAQAANEDQTASTTIKEKVIQGITDIADAPRKQWAVEVANVENEEGDITSTVERYRPHEDQSKQWTLIKIDDKEPTKRQLKRYAKKKRQEAEDKEQGKSIRINLKTLIMQDTLTLLADKENYAEFGFDVHMPKLGDDAVGKLKGTLMYRKQQGYIEQVTVVNKEEFSPLFSANISELRVALNFVKLDEVVLPLQYEMQMKGSFAYFTEIDETSTTTFSDYQRGSEIADEKVAEKVGE